MTGKTHLAPDARDRNALSCGLDAQTVDAPGLDGLGPSAQQTLIDDATGQGTRRAAQNCTRQPKNGTAKTRAKRCTDR